VRLEDIIEMKLTPKDLEKLNKKEIVSLLKECVTTILIMKMVLCNDCRVAMIEEGTRAMTIMRHQLN